MASGFNKVKLKAFNESIDAELTDMANSIKKLESAVGKIEKGENGVAYWSGKKARKHMTKLRKCIANDINVYNAYVDFINNLIQQANNQKDQ